MTAIGAVAAKLEEALVILKPLVGPESSASRAAMLLQGDIGRALTLAMELATCEALYDAANSTITGKQALDLVHERQVEILRDRVERNERAAALEDLLACVQTHVRPGWRTPELVAALDRIERIGART